MRLILAHGSRVVLLAGILFLMYWQHQRFLATQRSAGLDAVSLEVIQSLFPTATGIGEADDRGGRVVLHDSEELGSVFQTSPEGDRFLGFSGPTNTLIGLDRQSHVVGVAILSSRDTRDHVDLIRKDPRFLSAWNGKNVAEMETGSVDAVSGATLTSLAILQGIQSRLGGVTGSLKFPDDYSLEEAQRLFPDAATVSRDAQIPELWLAENGKGEPLGWLLSNSPAADNLIGYQGPTRAFLGMQLDGQITGLVVTQSFDNEPYVGYVRDDTWFPKIFDGKSLDELGRTRFEETGIEGVSGVTMTSQAVAESLLLAANKVSELRTRQDQELQRASVLRWKVAGTLTLIVMGLAVGLTSLRGRSNLRKIYQIVLIAVMGLMNGDLLSMAMFVGWAQSGIPWQNAMGLVCLTAAAVVLPIVTKTNVYCDHLCPHGAVQQLMPRRWKWKRRPKSLILILSTVRPVLLAIVVLVPMLHWSFSLVDLEPFDAYAWRAAGVATISVAVVGLTASLFLPMGYCHYGCPTGAVLGYLRRHARSGEFSSSDIVALSLLSLALLCFWL
ncbi:MAG TPA: FMN-binding protein [Planctomicrobium sp.]|nr:FMN-binding protein [Planctomicrobium sp.]